MADDEGRFPSRLRHRWLLLISVAPFVVVCACGTAPPAEESLGAITTVEPTPMSDPITAPPTPSTTPATSSVTAATPFVPSTSAVVVTVAQVGAPELVEPVLVDFPGFQAGLNTMFGDPQGAGVWFTQFTLDTGHELVHLVSVDPLVVDRWPLDEFGDQAFSANVGARKLSRRLRRFLAIGCV